GKSGYSAMCVLRSVSISAAVGISSAVRSGAGAVCGPFIGSSPAGASASGGPARLLPGGAGCGGAADGAVVLVGGVGLRGAPLTLVRRVGVGRVGGIGVDGIGVDGVEVGAVGAGRGVLSAGAPGRVLGRRAGLPAARPLEGEGVASDRVLAPAEVHEQPRGEEDRGVGAGDDPDEQGEGDVLEGAGAEQERADG